MKKKTFILSMLTLLSFSSLAQAKQSICVFDLLGKAGESYKLIEEWALTSKNWGAEVNLMPYQDEAKIEKDFKVGVCDAFT